MKILLLILLLILLIVILILLIVNITFFIYLNYAPYICYYIQKIKHHYRYMGNKYIPVVSLKDTRTYKDKLVVYHVNINYNPKRNPYIEKEDNAIIKVLEYEGMWQDIFNNTIKEEYILK